MRPFPFTAVVGMPDLRLGLVLSAISPSIGGVLVRGEKGTAKSTMVRALAGLLPAVDVLAGCRFSCDPADPDPGCPDGPHEGDGEVRTRRARLVELPVGAAEDRVVGSLDLEKALSEGVTDYQPGLLAGAHRGLLYVDEVNLLHDHLVDTLLDAAAMGKVTVEREGVSVSHAARFVLIGTMNPEEGELRPQLLDRFGLTVEVTASRDAPQRAEVVRRRLAYEADPGAFAGTYAESEARLAGDIATARALLPSVCLPDSALVRIAQVCAEFEVDGMRADIVTARTAIAHAAWSGRDTVTDEDIRVAARLALPHRRRRNPFDAPGLDEQRLDDVLRDSENEQTDGTDGTDGEGSAEPKEEETGGDSDPDPEPPEGGPGSGAPDNNGDDGTSSAGGNGERTVTSGDPGKAKLFTVEGTGTGAHGRRSRALTPSGRTVGVAAKGRSAAGPHLLATVRAAAPHQLARGRHGKGLVVRPGDVRYALREGKEGNLVLFCVDASGSMGARSRMREVKAAVLSLLLDAYQRRDKVGMVTFRSGAAEVALPPTISVEAGAARLDALPTGGRTPLAEGLLKAAEILRVEKLKDPARRPLLVVVTDGRATSGSRAVERAHAAADLLAATGVASVVLDCESGRMRLGMAADLAVRLGAEHVAVGEVAADAVTREVKARAA
ncbi:magnesium chelatase [Prauserella marina]|uniref:Mg-protoporphyrin IX chelatase n=1 Tax=Prauserella marina TaxID=530584 RepID=A0A222VL21_9PSEU|nr:putative cobaltochelatase [Prauserella marina]ASR34626.1 magnesium chelatase [Prauserella marina]PWV85734.1 magnesium chelatase subunit D [Prauserella marina]SDC47003.1 magnesium chelatase subunit D [Prauserella marina]